jgi:hypothetical protein
MNTYIPKYSIGSSGLLNSDNILVATEKPPKIFIAVH